jgi:hypothetical protein
MIVNATNDEKVSIRIRGRLLHSSESVVELSASRFMERFILFEPFDNFYYCYWTVCNTCDGSEIFSGAVKSFLLGPVKEYYYSLPTL